VPDLATIVKAYDIRGIVPDQLNEELARSFGAAFARFAGQADGGEGPAAALVVAHDMRDSSPGLAQAFADGAMQQGSDVVMVGLASTDMLYFASGQLDLPGAMFTASHNPARYNGIKLCLSGARPVGEDSGLLAIRSMVEEGVPAGDGRRGTLTHRDLLADYVAYLHSLVDLSGIRPLKVAVDAGNGMGGFTVPKAFEGLPIEVVPMYFELDGTFPNHEANPLEPKNLVDLQKRVLEVGADAGLAFDGDADRCFVVDEKGQPVSPSAVTALVAVRELEHEPGATIIHNLITSRAVPEIVREHGGNPVRTRVGHSFIKSEMASTGAIFGGEHSAHYYFRDFWRADTGMLAALHVLAALGHAPAEMTMSQLAADYSRYAASGEINTEVADQRATLARVRAVYADREGVTMDDLDGLTVSSADWWFNLRPSNTEPLLRLNCEAADVQLMASVRDDVLALVRS
jgi:phosphomannomutase